MSVPHTVVAAEELHTEMLLAVEPVQAVQLEKELQHAGLPARIVGEIINKTEPEISVL